MLALIKKDMLVHSWIVYSTMLLLIIVITSTTLPAIFVTLISLFSLAFSLFQYDHMRKVNISLKSMPIDAKHIVWSRYLFSIMLTGIILLIQWGLQYLFVLFIDNFDLVYQWQDFYVFFMLFCLLIGLLFPMMYFFKNMFSTMISISILIVIGIYYLIDTVVKTLDITDEIIFNDLDAGIKVVVNQWLPFSPYIILFVLTSILIYLSVICSIYLFKRRMY